MIQQKQNAYSPVMFSHNPKGSPSSPPTVVMAMWELNHCSAQDFIDLLWRSPPWQRSLLPMNHVDNCVVHRLASAL